MIDYSMAIMGTKPGTKKENIEETKVYGVAQISEKVSLEDFAEHISSHNSVYDKDDVSAILGKAVRCMREMLLQGKKICLGELGSFHCTLKCKGAKTPGDWTHNNIKDVNVAWTKGEKFTNLMQVAEFHLVPSRNAQAVSLEEEKSQTTIVKGDLS